MAWAKIPTAWVREDLRLPDLSWRQFGSDGTAALMVLIALAIRLNQSNMKREDDTGFGSNVEVSYDNLEELTELSRTKLAAGLRILEQFSIIETTRNGRSNRYVLPGIGEAGKWSQLPQTYLLTATEGLRGFSRFQLRHRNELNALKLYFLLLAYRNAKGNFTAVGYEKISELSGLMRGDISGAVSLLINHDLIRVSQSDGDGVAGRPYNQYKIRGLGAF